MELWIRSQDKSKLVKVDKILIENSEIGNFEVGMLGKYKTKERTLEILDEINEIKYYKYMASLDWTLFARSVLKPKPIEEQRLLLAMMNTYIMPKE